MISVAAILAVLRHPSLWIEALRTAFALAPDAWWRTPPFLPIPDPVYLRWRVASAYGDPKSTIAPEDLIAYLGWRKQLRSQG